MLRAPRLVEPSYRTGVAFGTVTTEPGHWLHLGTAWAQGLGRLILH